MSLVLIGLGAMRVGLLTRFMGYLGIFSGVLLMLPARPGPGGGGVLAAGARLSVHGPVAQRPAAGVGERQGGEVAVVRGDARGANPRPRRHPAARETRQARPDAGTRTGCGGSGRPHASRHAQAQAQAPQVASRFGHPSAQLSLITARADGSAQAQLRQPLARCNSRSVPASPLSDSPGCSGGQRPGRDCPGPRSTPGARTAGPFGNRWSRGPDRSSRWRCRSSIGGCTTPVGGHLCAALVNQRREDGKLATPGAREADVAPAPDPTGGRSATWTPADPGPLGLAGFAGTTFVLSMINTNLVGIGSLPVVFGLALAYGGIAQFAAGLWEFRTGNTFGAVAFCSFGAFWISYYFLVHTALPAKSAHSAHRSVPVDVGDLHRLHVHRRRCGPRAPSRRCSCC